MTASLPPFNILFGYSFVFCIIGVLFSFYIVYVLSIFVAIQHTNTTITPQDGLCP